MMRIPSAARLNAISSSKFLILLILVPSAGTISYNVIVGPIVAFILLISTPKFPSTCVIRSLLAFCSAISIAGVLSSELSIKSSVGYSYDSRSSFGSYGVLMPPRSISPLPCSVSEVVTSKSGPFSSRFSLSFSSVNFSECSDKSKSILFS